jgi:hypothetical protein
LVHFESLKALVPAFSALVMTGVQIGAHAGFLVLFEANGGFVIVAAVGHVFRQGENIVQRIGESV